MLVFRKRAGVETSKRIEEILYGMYDYVMHAAGPDHFQIAQGDSDVTDIRDVMTRGAMLFEESAFKYAGYEEPDLESIWCFGMEQKEQYLKLKSKTAGNIERSLYRQRKLLLQKRLGDRQQLYVSS
mgnify:CR=1 FL=1